MVCLFFNEKESGGHSVAPPRIFFRIFKISFHYFLTFSVAVKECNAILNHFFMTILFSLKDLEFFSLNILKFQFSEYV